MKKLLLIVFLAALSVATVHAQKKTFTREYTYQASEDDSRNTARTAATNQMRKTLLREVGEFIHIEETFVADNNRAEYSEKIEGITAGIVDMKILEEEYDGATYYVKAAMTVDINDVKRRIAEVLNDKQKTKELEEARKRSLAAEAESARLRKELEETKKTKNEPQRLALQKEYQQQMTLLSAEEYFTRANVALNHGWNEKAMEQYNQAYDRLPKSEETYLLMGNAYSKVRDEGLEKAAECYENYLRTNPKDADVCVALGDVYRQIAGSSYGDGRPYSDLYKETYKRAEGLYEDIIIYNPNDLNNLEIYEKLHDIASRLRNEVDEKKYQEKITEIKQKLERQKRELSGMYYITGRVEDKKGNPIPGANIVIKGTARGTISDENGNYIIEAHVNEDKLIFSFIGFKSQLVALPGHSDVINVTLLESRSLGGGAFLSYIYDNSPLKSGGPMHGVGLFHFGSGYSRWGWYASFRANAEFFQSNREPLSVPGFAFNAGAILKLFPAVALYIGPGVGSHVVHTPSGSGANEEPSVEKKRAWYFNPEAGLALNLRYVTLFGGIKYPLPADEAHEKILWSAGAGINFGRIFNDLGNADWSGVPGGAFLSYIYDSGPLKSAGPMHGVGLFNFLTEDNRWGWYASFRANAAFFQSNPEPLSVPGFAFNAGAILKLFPAVALYIGPGVGNYAYDALSIDAAGVLTNEKKQEWYFNPEVGLALNFRYVTLFGGIKYPLPADEAYEKILWSAGAGFLMDPEESCGAYDDVGRMLVSYMPDIPVSTTSKNPPGYIGLTLGGLYNIGYGGIGGYGSFRGNALIFGGGEDSDLAHTSATVGVIGSPMLHPLYFSVGIGGYWEWSKYADATAYVMPEIGVHLLCYNHVLLSVGRSFPGFKSDKVIYTAGIGILLETE